MRKISALLILIAVCNLLQAQIPTSGLVTYWPMDGSFSDNGPNVINGTNQGATATTNRFGTANTAMAFSNPTSTVAQFATHPINANLNFSASQDFSVDFSIYISSPVSHAGGLYDNNLNYGGLGIWFWNANGFPQVNMNYKNGNIGTTNGALATDAWYHISCMRSAGTMKIYINGVLNVSGLEGAVTPVYNFPTRFGTMFYNGFSPAEYNGFNGKMDGMRIYNRALTDQEILQLYNADISGNTQWYVNDNSLTGDVFTSAVGNDLNTGSAAAPFATLNKAISVAIAGDIIYVDAGTYTAGGAINKSLTIRGANYLISPNDAADPLLANGSRNAETIISNTSLDIGASNISIEGITFDPQSNIAIKQINNSLDFDNVSITKNIFRNKSDNRAIQITGKNQLPLVTFDYFITGNRFIKEVSNGNAAIIAGLINNIQILNNTFTVSADVANRTQTDINLSSSRSDNVVISHNIAYRQNNFVSGINALNARIDFNKAIECNRLVNNSNNLSDPCIVDISDNIVTDPKGGAPSIGYQKNNGTNLSSPNIARIERNTITLNGTGLSSIPPALITANLDDATQNSQVYIRGNKLSFSGNFSSLSDPSAFIAGIRFLNNSRQAVAERNEIEFNATNYNATNKCGIYIVHYNLQAGTNFDILNNKISGFPTSLAIQQNDPFSATGVGPFGQLPGWASANVNNNSFINDVLSINNGTQSQSVNASCNWYGSAAAQNFINKLSLPTVDIAPWLTNGTDNDVATGFQPVPNSCDGYPTLITLDGYTNVTCNGAANGSINITTTYGKAPFIYTWTKDGDAGFISHNEDPTNLGPGTYHLALVDGNGSNIYIINPEADGPGTIDLTITEPTVLNATPNGTNNLCFGGSNGTADVIVSGGTTPYSYLWSNGANTSAISNLLAGIYTVMVTDAKGCTASAGYTVTQPVNLYVNDNSIAGDVFTSAIGNDNNCGSMSAPFATITKALSIAASGSIIYVDAGTYGFSDFTINKEVSVIGANYLISPNDLTNALLPNAGRNAESNISNCTITIGAANINIKGLSFDPTSKTQIQQTNTANDFDNVSISKNIFHITSGSTLLNISGKQINPLVTFNYTITDNRFIKEVSAGGTAINISKINGISIQNNTFTVSADIANRTEFDMNLSSYRSDNVVISQNIAYRQNSLVSGINALNARIDFNKAIECNRFVNNSNNLSDPCIVDISDNIVTDPKGGAPSIGYQKNNGTNLSSPNIGRIERNTITLNGTGSSSIAAALITANLDDATQNNQVYIRDNKLSFSGNFSSLSDPSAYIAGIRFFNNSRQAVVERNEIEFTATNYNTTNKCGIYILHYNLQPGTNFDILNNKISGFPTSLAIQLNIPSSSTDVGAFGQLPAWVTTNINNNSFTNDILSINNGTQSQSVNASCNWYGSAAVQNFINKLTLPTVDIIPWLINGTDNDVATGFQPVPNSCDGYPTLITLDGYTNVTCNGANNGTINITATYGKVPFIYTWIKDGDAGFISHEEDPTNFGPGTYHLSLVDGNGSTLYVTDPEADGPGTIDVTITEPDILTASASGINVSCFNGANGTASVTAGGGTLPYTYAWSNGATTSSISNLTAGTYNVTVTDANGCTALSGYEVTQPSLLVATATGTNVDCNGNSTGSASVNVTGGTIEYSYLWSNGATTSFISNLPAGTYSVTVTDANGCTANSNYEVTEPALLVATASGTNVDCHGNNTGSASVNVSGGTDAYSYLWSNGATTSSISNLSAGTYSVTVTDAHGCTATSGYEVTEPAILTATASGTNVSCFGGNNGTASVNISGGTAAYSYLWSNGATTSSISNLPAGTYSVTVTDANGCTATSEYIVTQPPVLTATTLIVNNLCYNGTMGSISVTAAGGTAGYEYSLNGTSYQGSNVFNNLAANNYTVYIKDSKGCIFSVAALVTQPPAIIISISNVTNTCSGSATGSITISVAGGTGAYTYSWTGPNGFAKNSKNLTSLVAGTYNLTVTDANGCTATSQAEVGVLPAITLGGAITHVQCFGTTTGAVNITVGGGSGTFSFTWSGPNGYKATTEDISNIKAGTYSVTVKDASGCSISQSYIVTQPAALTVTIVKTDISTCNGTGTVTATASGGTITYLYKINNGNFLPGNVFNNLAIGSHTVTVQDANGCQATASVSIADNGNDQYESNNKIADAASILVNQVLFARIAPSSTDKDWYQFTTSAIAVPYTLTVLHGSVNYTFNLYDNKGKVITAGSSSATTKTYNSLAINTTYFIQVSGALSYTCYQLSVTAGQLITQSSGNNPAQEINQQNLVKGRFDVKVLGNPSHSGFILNVISSSEEKMSLKIMDISGRLIEQRSNLHAGEKIRLGESYKNGVYLAEIMQGSIRKTMKLVKL